MLINDDWTELSPYDRVLTQQQRRISDTWNNKEERQRYCAKWQKSDTEGYVSIPVKSWQIRVAWVMDGEGDSLQEVRGNS